jgi:hypothetical protein
MFREGRELFRQSYFFHPRHYSILPQGAAASKLPGRFGNRPFLLFAGH